MFAVKFPGCSQLETTILQLRASGKNYRAIEAQTGLSPRRVWLIEHDAMTKVVKYLEREVFLSGNSNEERRRNHERNTG